MDDLEALVHTIQATDAAASQKQIAFTALVRRFQDMVYGCAYGILGDPQAAQDVAQESFL